MTSKEKARKVCVNLSRAVARVTPRGLGAWGPAWDYVEGPSVAFLDALGDFEVADTPTTREKLQRAAGEVVGAWRRAGEEWQAAGRPGAPEEVTT